MTKPTGNPPGRPKGRKNKRAVEMAEKTAQLAPIIEPMLDEPFEGDAHAYLMSVYKDRTANRAERIDAAGKAIRYEKPALATIEQRNEIKYRVSDKPLTEDEWIAQHCGERGTDKPH